MIIRIWDFLFTRKVWTTIKEEKLHTEGVWSGWACVLQDQFGNIKKKKIQF